MAEKSYLVPTPRSGALGMIADALKKASGALDIKSPNYRPGDMHLPLGTLLGIEALGNVADHASYGDSPFVEAKGVTNSPFPTFKAGRGEELRDATLAALPLAPAAGKAVGGLARGVAREVVNAPTGMRGPLSLQDGAIKLKGGNWNEKSVDEFVTNSIAGAEDNRELAPETIRWARTVLPKHIKKYMGTEEDPLIALGSDKMHIPQSELIDNTFDTGVSSGIAKDFQNANMEKRGIDVLPPWEHIGDSMVDAKTVGSFSGVPITELNKWDRAHALRGKINLEAYNTFGESSRVISDGHGSFRVIGPNSKGDGFQPWMEKADPNTPVYEMKQTWGSAPHHFDKIIQHVDSLGLSPDDLQRYPVDLAVRQIAKKREAYMKDIAEKGLNPPPKQLKAYDDGHQWVQLDQPGQFAAESDMMSHSVRGYEPPGMRGPNGDLGGDSRYGVGTGGWEGIKDGTAQVHSLRGPDGKSIATVEAEKKIYKINKDDKKFGDLSPEEKQVYIDDGIPSELAAIKKFGDDANLLSLSNGKYEVTPPQAMTITQIKGANNQPIQDPLGREKILDYLNTHHVDSKLHPTDLRSNSITDMNNIVRDQGYQQEYIDYLRSQIGDKRFIDSYTEDQIYNRWFMAKEKVQDDAVELTRSLEYDAWANQPLNPAQLDNLLGQ